MNQQTLPERESLNHFSAQNRLCVFKDTNILLMNPYHYLPNQVERITQHEFYQRSVVSRDLSNNANQTNATQSIVVNNTQRPIEQQRPIKQPVVRNNKANEGTSSVVNDSKIVWYLIPEKVKQPKQVINPEAYKEHKDKIRSISLKELEESRSCLVLKNTYEKVTNPEDHNPQDLIIINETTYYRKKRRGNNQRASKAANDSTVVWYLIPKNPQQPKQVVNPEAYKEHKDKIKPISLKELAKKELCLVLKNSYEKVTNPEDHNPQDLIIISNSTYRKHRKNDPTKNQDNNNRSPTKGKNNAGKRKAPQQPAGPSKRKKTAAASESLTVEKPKTASSQYSASALLLFAKSNTNQTGSLSALRQETLPNQKNKTQNQDLSYSNDNKSYLR